MLSSFAPWALHMILAWKKQNWMNLWIPHSVKVINKSSQVTNITYSRHCVFTFKVNNHRNAGRFESNDFSGLTASFINAINKSCWNSCTSTQVQIVSYLKLIPLKRQYSYLSQPSLLYLNLKTFASNCTFYWCRLYHIAFKIYLVAYRGRLIFFI